MASQHGDDLDVLIRTGITGPLAIGLAESLLKEGGIPFFAMDRNVAARQESGNFLGWWDIRVPRELEAEAREILRSVEEMKYAEQPPDLDSNDPAPGPDPEIALTEEPATGRKRDGRRVFWRVAAPLTCIAVIGGGVILWPVYKKNAMDRKLAEAAREYLVRALQGDAKAEYDLGASYDRGRGVPQDYIEAVR